MQEHLSRVSSSKVLPDRGSPTPKNRKGGGLKAFMLEQGEINQQMQEDIQALKSRDHGNESPLREKLTHEGVSKEKVEELINEIVVEKMREMMEP